MCVYSHCYGISYNQKSVILIFLAITIWEAAQKRSHKIATTFAIAKLKRWQYCYRNILKFRVLIGYQKYFAFRVGWAPIHNIFAEICTSDRMLGSRIVKTRGARTSVGSYCFHRILDSPLKRKTKRERKLKFCTL